MFCSVLLGVALLGSTHEAPYNYTGKLTDLLPEGASWGMPKTGLPMQILIERKGESVSPATFSLKGPKWTSAADLNLKGLAYAAGTLSGSVSFKNGSGFALDAVRFDVVVATERYKGKNPKGEEVEMTRTLPVAEESPLLLGDVVKGADAEGGDFKATGLAWKPETIDITVTAKLSGLTYQRSMFPDHSSSFLDFDAKGRLLLGSGQQSAIYRVDLEKESLDQITSTPSYKVQIASNPVDGSICARWMNAQGFSLYTPGGDEKATFMESETDGMGGWTNLCRFDGKGNLYLGFGETVSQFKGDKPSFVLKACGQFPFAEYLQFDVNREGAIYVASNKNVFRFEPGGKNGKLLIKGPDVKLGRIHDFDCIRVDPSGNVWIAEPVEDTFMPRISVFDADGKFIWVFGRGGDRRPEDGYLDGQIPSGTKSIAVSADGRVYLGGSEGAKSVLEFIEF